MKYWMQVPEKQHFDLLTALPYLIIRLNQTICITTSTTNSLEGLTFYIKRNISHTFLRNPALGLRNRKDKMIKMVAAKDSGCCAALRVRHKCSKFSDGSYKKMLTHAFSIIGNMRACVCMCVSICYVCCCCYV